MKDIASRQAASPPAPGADEADSVPQLPSDSPGGTAPGIGFRAKVALSNALRWRDRLRCNAWAMHVVGDIFPAIRQRGGKRLDLHTVSGEPRCLASTTLGAPATFFGTEHLNGALRRRGVSALQLMTGLTARQVSRAIRMILFALPEGGSTSGFERSAASEDRVQRALQSPTGMRHQGVDVRWAPKSGTLHLGPGLAGRSPWRDVAANAGLPVLALGAWAFALAHAYVDHHTMALSCLWCQGTAAFGTLSGLAGLGSTAYTRFQRGVLLRSCWHGIHAQHSAIETQNEALRQANALKDTLLQVGSHDIRSPLVNIMLLSEAHLTRSKRSMDPSKAWRLVHAEAERIRGIVENYMNLERIQQGKLVADCASFDLNAVVRSVLDARYPEAETRHLLLDTYLDDMLPPACGDTRHVVEVLHNYLGNAMKFAPVGTSIRIATAAHEGLARVSVSDNGPGVPICDRARLFQEFVQLVAQPVGRDFGTGLGLAIARKLMECQGGTVGAEFPESGGSVFWFELPVAEELALATSDSDC